MAAVVRYEYYVCNHVKRIIYQFCVETRLDVNINERLSGNALCFRFVRKLSKVVTIMSLQTK